MASAVATWDGELPEAEVLESPTEFRLWFDAWTEERKRSRSRDRGEPDEHTWEFR